MQMVRIVLTSFLVSLAAVSSSSAQSPTPESLKLYVENAAGGIGGRAEVTVGALDPRIDLSACTRLEPFVPPGARLWGRAWIGVRCTEGPALTAYFPVHVKLFGSALLAGRAFAAGTSLAPADVRLEEVELTREPPGALADPSFVGGKVLARPIAAGQVLRAEHFRAPPAVAAGDSVKLVYAGTGFTVSTEGRAIGAAAAGQPVRVQTGTGKTLSGIAREGRIVQVGYEKRP
jgi:flagella basal body P-ring formation protein FlgA